MGSPQPCPTSKAKKECRRYEHILGDVIDRGPKPLNCLRFIMRIESVHLLRGNHEDMMLDFIKRKSYAWERNGSGPTQTQPIYETTEEARQISSQTPVI